MRVLAIIPARGGSKGIRRKNMVNFNGKPLIQWSIDAANKSKYITDILVTSDDDEILEYARKTNGVIDLKRPKELAKDNSRTEPVLVHALKNIDKEYDYLILLQPTSPLRTTEDIDLAFQKLINSEGASLISVCNIEVHPYKSFKVDKNGFLQGIINNEFPFYPRQKLPKVYKPNGAIYIIETAIFLKLEKLHTQRTIHYEMSKEKSLDVDVLTDLI
ncbi:acylneuraminate cytidylyltransferase family protein [Polaribacter sp. ALD11]|uniref:acylneuraminate cytidylyltransferase family protein n=1 Tax=Polaribacter sp. ALD11 TaxID=2058137 RepID=UPI0018E1FEF9|nr:acylneuraminate cytidylyltransferase family protein [Polaribacter sp. ALD11]